MRSSSELVTLYLDAVRRRDISIVDHFFHPEVEYVVNGTPTLDSTGPVPAISAQCHAALPWLGLHRGRGAVKEFLAHMHRNLEVTAFGTRAVVSEGKQAAAFGWFRLHALPTHQTVDIPFAVRLELRDGLIIKYHFLENTLDVALAFRSSGEWQLNTDEAQHSVPSA